VVQGAIPYLRSDSPVLLRGAIIAIYRIALPQDSRVSPTVQDQADDALMNAADRIAAADAQTATDYAAALGMVKNDRALGGAFQGPAYDDSQCPGRVPQREPDQIEISLEVELIKAVDY